MVVKGDGSLVSAEFALDRPVETILSGPAASVVGARHLAGEERRRRLRHGRHDDRYRAARRRSAGAGSGRRHGGRLADHGRGGRRPYLRSRRRQRGPPRGQWPSGRAAPAGAAQPALPRNIPPCWRYCARSTRPIASNRRAGRFALRNSVARYRRRRACRRPRRGLWAALADGPVAADAISPAAMPRARRSSGWSSAGWCLSAGSRRAMRHAYPRAAMREWSERGGATGRGAVDPGRRGGGPSGRSRRGDPWRAAWSRRRFCNPAEPSSTPPWRNEGEAALRPAARSAGNWSIVRSAGRRRGAAVDDRI